VHVYLGNTMFPCGDQTGVLLTVMCCPKANITGKDLYLCQLLSSIGRKVLVQRAGADSFVQRQGQGRRLRAGARRRCLQTCAMTGLLFFYPFNAARLAPGNAQALAALPQ
jgi:hypothetical protein